MFSTLTERGATATLDALSLGANDYVHKPANVGSVVVAQQRIKDELVPKVKVLAGVRAIKNGSANGLAPTLNEMGLLAQRIKKTIPPATTPLVTAASSPRPSSNVRRNHTPIQVVVLGISTGGPNALDELFVSLPKSLPVPLLIVQHMPPMFTRLLAERLATRSGMPVKEAKGGEIVKPGDVWIAPGDYHMVVRKTDDTVRLVLNQEPQENSCRPAVDPLFRSATDIYGRSTLGVIMTGMGKDGLNGCEAIHKAEGQIIVQDEATSVVWGMPGFVAEAGLADAELPLGELAGEIVRRINQGRLVRV